MVTIELKMPALSPTMEKGTLARWLVKVGDIVKAGDLLAEIETDKATMEFEAVDDGQITALMVTDGSDDVPVGTVIATMIGVDEAAEVPILETVAVEVATPINIEIPEVAEVSRPDPVPTSVEPTNASPLARRIAGAKGLNLDNISGTGPRGRVLKADLGLKSLLVQETTSAPVHEAAYLVYDPPIGVPVETIKLSTMRKTIARRLTESKQNVPHFYLTARCQTDALLALRKELNDGFAVRNIKLSVNDLLIKAMAIALIEVPDANVQFGGDSIYRFNKVDISMAVAIEGGLVTPVIRGANRLSLSALAASSKSLVAKAREGKLQPEDYQGGTASISNLGMFGIDEIFPVINPPQALILGIGAGIEQPWKVDGSIKLATIMAATASFDHRVIDGAVAAQFMAAFKSCIENPMKILT